MPEPIVLVGALDTKGREFAFVRDLLRARGLDVIVVDFGVVGDPTFEPDIGADRIAEAGGTPLSELRNRADKTLAMHTMSEGLIRVVGELYEAGQLGGILGMGGSGGTSLATAAMRALPVGVPKVMVSTVAAGGDESSPEPFLLLSKNSPRPFENLFEEKRRAVWNSNVGLVHLTIDPQGRAPIGCQCQEFLQPRHRADAGNAPPASHASGNLLGDHQRGCRHDSGNPLVQDSREQRRPSSKGVTGQCDGKGLGGLVGLDIHHKGPSLSGHLQGGLQAGAGPHQRRMGLLVHLGT